EDGLYTDLGERGLEPPAEMRAVRQRAAALVGQPDLSGLPTWRFSIPEPGAVLRFNRAEGLYLGGGIAWIPSAGRSMRLLAGYGFATERRSRGAPFSDQLSRAVLARRDIGWDRLRDIGLRTALP